MLRHVLSALNLEAPKPCKEIYPKVFGVENTRETRIIVTILGPVRSIICW